MSGTIFSTQPLSESPLKRLAMIPVYMAPMIAAIILSYCTGEMYPFSSFPMYSKFDDRTYYVILRDAEGKQIPTAEAFQVFASQLKKEYGRHLDDLKEDHEGSHFDWSAEVRGEAGQATLDWLRTDRAPDAFKDGRYTGMELVDVRITMEDGKPVEKGEVVARLPPSAP